MRAVTTVSYDRSLEYIDFLIRQFVTKPEHKAVGVHIAYIKNMREMVAYIQDHPKLNKVGFIKKIDQHFFPIYYEKKNGKICLLQMDAFADLHALPVIDVDVPTVSYYSPVWRIVGQGCLEDAVEVLAKCFHESDLPDFCERHSKEPSFKSLVEDASLQDLKRLIGEQSLRGLEQLLKVNVVFFAGYVETQIKLLETDKVPVKEIKRLTRIPHCFLVDIEYSKGIEQCYKEQKADFGRVYTHNKQGREVTIMEFLQSLPDTGRCSKLLGVNLPNFESRTRDFQERYLQERYKEEKSLC